MVLPAAGPPNPVPVPAQMRDDTSRAIEHDWRKKGPGPNGVFTLRFRGMYFIERNFDVETEVASDFAQRYFNCLNVSQRSNTAVRINLAALGEGFNPPVAQPGVFGLVPSWRPSGLAADISGPHHDLSQGTDQRLGMLRLALRLWQHLYEVNNKTLPPLPQMNMQPRKPSLVKLGIFLSFLPVELADKPFNSIYQTLQEIRADKF